MFGHYHDFHCYHKNKCNELFLRSCQSYLSNINMIVLDGSLLQTTKMCFPFVNHIQIVERDADTIEKMEYQIFIHQYYNKVRVSHSLLSDFLDNDKNDRKLAYCNAIYMDTMSSLEGNKTTGIYPLYDIESFLLKTTHKNVVVGVTVCKRSAHELINSYDNIEEQYESFLFNIITYCQFRIKDVKKHSYQRGYKTMPMICFVFKLRKDRRIRFNNVDFHVDKQGRFYGYP